MKPEITIRLAAPEDAGQLAELGRETFHDAFVSHPLMPTADLNAYLTETFTVRRMAGELQDPGVFFLLAETAGKPAGYAKLAAQLRTPGIRGNNPIKLHRLYSKKEFIGAGIGAGLITRCLQETADRGHDTIWLTVWEHNLRAQAFYRKWNFEPGGLIDFRLGQSTLTDVLMQREIQLL